MWIFGSVLFPRCTCGKTNKCQMQEHKYPCLFHHDKDNSEVCTPWSPELLHMLESELSSKFWDFAWYQTLWGFFPCSTSFPAELHGISVYPNKQQKITNHFYITPICRNTSGDTNLMCVLMTSEVIIQTWDICPHRREPPAENHLSLKS